MAQRCNIRYNSSLIGRFSYESNSHGTTQVDTFTNPPALPDIPGTVSATALVNVELATVSSTVFGSGDDIQLTLQVSDGHSLRCTGNRTIATTTSSDTGSVVPVSCSFQQAHGVCLHFLSLRSKPLTHS